MLAAKPRMIVDRDSVEGRKEVRWETGGGCTIKEILVSDSCCFQSEMLELAFKITGSI